MKEITMSELDTAHMFVQVIRNERQVLGYVSCADIWKYDERSIGGCASPFVKLLENKADADTVIENGEVVRDMLLNIDDITIDDISLGNLLWSAEYILDKKRIYKGQEIDHLDGCVNLGWNGTYVLKFTSPFYIWLLEKL